MKRTRRVALLISIEFGCLLHDYLQIEDADAALQYLEDHIEDWAQEFEASEVQGRISGDNIGKLEQYAHEKFREAGWLPDRGKTQILCRQEKPDGAYEYLRYILDGTLPEEQKIRITGYC